MPGRILLSLLLYSYVFTAIASYQDHVITWTLQNQRLTGTERILRVREGDNIIFDCSKEYYSKEQLYWTRNQREYNNCAMSNQTKKHKLLDCGDQSGGSDFLLKVSQFSEINQLPTFHKNSAVYFLSQPEYCLRHRLKLAVYKVVSGTDNRMDRNKLMKEGNQTPELLNDPEQSNSSNYDELERNRSFWTRYRFLFIPGILGLITMIGIQSMLCVLWKRRSVQALQHNQHRCHFCHIQCCCNPQDNCFSSDRSKSISPSKIDTTTFSIDCNPDSNERSKTKRVEFISNNPRSSHSHMGIGTMPKHLISQTVTKHKTVRKPDLTNQNWQNTSYVQHQKQTAVYCNKEHACEQPINGQVSKANCAKKVQQCCTDRQRGLLAQNDMENNHSCIFMDDCATYILPVSNFTFAQTMVCKNGSQDYNDKVINISV